MNLYCVVDEKAGVICMTFSSINEATARRSFEDLIAAVAPSVFTMHPEDFSLYSLVEVELDKGLPLVCDKLNKICSGLDYSAAVLKTLREERINQFNFSTVKEESVNE